MFEISIQDQEEDDEFDSQVVPLLKPQSPSFSQSKCMLGGCWWQQRSKAIEVYRALGYGTACCLLTTFEVHLHVHGPKLVAKLEPSRRGS